MIDYHAFGLVSSRSYTFLKDVDVSITDRKLRSDITEEYRKYGANLILA